MHQKLSMITKGSHAGLDYIQIPTAPWYYSAKQKELYHYNNGVFEYHVPSYLKEREFIHHHTLKVIPDDAMELEVDDINEQGFRMTYGQYIRSIGWTHISEKRKLKNTCFKGIGNTFSKWLWKKAPQP